LVKGIEGKAGGEAGEQKGRDKKEGRVGKE